MWSRILRLLSSTLHIYSLYTNPFRYIFSLLLLMAVPYLVYVFWGGLIILGLIGLGLYFLYRMVKRSKNEVYT